VRSGAGLKARRRLKSKPHLSYIAHNAAGRETIFLATLLERALRCALWMGISMSGDKIA